MGHSKILSSFVMDEEFENLIMPLSDVDLHRLQIKVRAQKLGKIRVWENIVICDSQIYLYCKEFNIPCEVDQKHFATRNEALSYVCNEELKRDDLTYEYKKYLIGKNYLLHMKGNNSIKATKVGVARNVGKEYSLSPGAVLKYGQYAYAMDHVFCVSTDAAAGILNGTIKLSHDITIEVSGYSREELRVIGEIANESKGKKGISDIRHAIRQNMAARSSKSKSRIKQKKVSEVEIKKMPAYDPDADISSIALTIPSWINAINRAVDNTAIEETTVNGRNRLKDQLYALDDTIINVIRRLEVKNNERSF